MICRIDNALRIDSGPEGLVAALRAKFTFPNPVWPRNRQLKLSNYKTPRYIKLVEENAAEIILPRGLVTQIATTQIIDKTVLRPIDLSDPTFFLRPYQVPAVETVLRKNQGLLVAPAGSGKTNMAIHILMKRKQRTLILCHTLDLATQWRQRLEEFGGIRAGLIDGTAYDERDVTVGLVQSLRDIEDIEFYQSWGMIIADECHHIPARTIYDLINKFPGRYRLGLSATPRRIDGLSFMLHACMGSTLYEVPQEELFDAGMLVEPEIVAVYTGANGSYDNYVEMINALSENEARNDLILDLAAQETQEHYVLILCERIKHAQELQRIFQQRWPGIPSACLTSKTPQKDRDSTLESMRSGRLRLITATRVAEEGLDLPICDRIFLTMPMRSKNKCQQIIGRSMRLHPEKIDAKIFDFIDDISLARSQFYTRRREVYSGFRITELRDMSI